MTRFLRAFFKIFYGLFRKNVGDPLTVKDEDVTRYVFDKNSFRPSNQTVKYQAFWPHRGETSVFRISGLADVDVWSIGNEHVAKLRQKPLKARADIATNAVEAVGAAVGISGLKVVAETSTHPLHANIVGWPPDESAVQMIAVELASHAKLHFPT